MRDEALNGFPSCPLWLEILVLLACLAVQYWSSFVSFVSFVVQLSILSAFICVYAVTTTIRPGPRTLILCT